MVAIWPLATASAGGQQLQRGDEGQGDAFASFGYAGRIGAGQPGDLAEQSVR